MNVFITGGAGFVGWHLCDLVLNESHTVTCYDILNPLVVNPDLGSVGDHPRFSLIKGDVLNLDALCASMTGHDLVIHAAAQSAVDRSIRDPISTFQVNALGTVNVLEATRRVGINRLHYVSTDEVFGVATFASFTEDSPWRPRNPYAAGKAAGEATVSAWGNTTRTVWQSQQLTAQTTTGNDKAWIRSSLE